MSDTAASKNKKQSFLRGLFFKEKPAPKAAPKPAPAPPGEKDPVPKVFDKASKDLPSFQAQTLLQEPVHEPEPELTEEELRGKILDAIPDESDEPEVRLTEKISAVCVSLQKIQYESTIQPLIQAGLDMALNHWLRIHRRLERNEPVEVEEARRTAQAIDNMLRYAPHLRWALVRKINSEHLCALQGMEDGLIQEGPLKKKCLKGLGFLVDDFVEEKGILREARLKGPHEDPRSEAPPHASSKDKRIAQEATRELLENPQAKETPPGKIQILQPQAAGVGPAL